MRVISSVCALIAVGLLGAHAAQAAISTYTTVLSHTGEADPPSSGTGSATVKIDTTAHTMTVDATFSGLNGLTTASHIHAATASPGTGSAGVATQTPTFSLFPIGVTSGTFHQVLDTSSLASWNSPYVTANGGTALGSEAALIAALNAGEAYLNIHTSTNTGGEIRGFLVVPEPSTLTLFGVGVLGLLARRRSTGRATTDPARMA